jgi:hypothetical protein
MPNELDGITRADRDPGFRRIALLAILTLATWIAADWLRTGTDAAFYPYAAPGVSWYAVGLLVTAAILARLSVPAVSVWRVLTELLAAMPILIVALSLVQKTYELSSLAARLAFGAVCICLVFYVARSLRRMSARQRLRAVSIAALFVIGFAWASEVLMVDVHLWSDAADEQEEVAPDDAESLLFSQSALIDGAVAGIAPSAPEAPSAFLVGFAGYGAQKVFAEEIKLAARTLGTHFGSDRRDVLLMNDRRSLHDAPLASPTALRYALRAVAARMNLQKDVLFLSISSHGSEDGLLAVSNHGLPIDDLDIETLRAALDDSGIVWRVIVISACYSGQYVDPLSTPRTAVITASAADRASFGCTDDRDLTYFGEAFYRDALPGARSLRDAFVRARAAIESREKAEGVKPSHPQAFFGSEIEAKLAQLSAQ